MMNMKMSGSCVGRIWTLACPSCSQLVLSAKKIRKVGCVQGISAFLTTVLTRLSLSMRASSRNHVSSAKKEPRQDKKCPPLPVKWKMVLQSKVLVETISSFNRFDWHVETNNMPPHEYSTMSSSTVSVFVKCSCGV